MEENREEKNPVTDMMERMDAALVELDKDSADRDIRKDVKKDTELARRHYGVLVVAGIAIVGVILILLLLSATAKKSAEVYADSYETTKNKIIKDMKEDAYAKAYAEAEAKYHVSNQAVISVATLTEKASLEVLKVYDVEYEIDDKKTNDEGITAWLEVPGEGVYTVDLKPAEFIVDNARKHVLVRVPRPELEYVKIIYEDVKQLLFDNKGGNDSISIGADMAKQQLGKAAERIQKSLASNANFYSSAERAAKSMIVGLIKSFNKNVENLTVEVEFFD